MEGLKSEDIIQDFVLVIPTKNRHEYLLRTLEYYGNKEIKVMVCDGSDKPLAAPPSYKNVTYYHFPDETFTSKLHKVFHNYINESYACLCADDDFILISAIKECLVFLKNNPDYATVQGEYLEHEWNNSHNFKLADKPKYIGANINSNFLLKRVYDLMTDFFPVFYFVGRKEVFEKVFNKETTLIRNLNLFAMVLSTISICEGKHKVLQNVFGIRERLKEAERYNLTFADYKKSKKKELKQEYEAFFISLNFYLDNYKGVNALSKKILFYLLNFRIKKRKKKKYRRNIKSAYQNEMYNKAELSEIIKLIQKEKSNYNFQ